MYIPLFINPTAGCRRAVFINTACDIFLSHAVLEVRYPALAGSTLELCDGIRNLVRFAGATLGQAVACATANPAKMLGIYDTCGSLEVGKYADIVVAREDDKEIFVIEAVLLDGEAI